MVHGVLLKLSVARNSQHWTYSPGIAHQHRQLPQCGMSQNPPPIYSSSSFQTRGGLIFHKPWKGECGELEFQLRSSLSLSTSELSSPSVESNLPGGWENDSGFVKPLLSPLDRTSGNPVSWMTAPLFISVYLSLLIHLSFSPFLIFCVYLQHRASVAQFWNEITLTELLCNSYNKLSALWGPPVNLWAAEWLMTWSLNQS